MCDRHRRLFQQIYENDVENFDIVFELSQDGAELPPEVAGFHKDIERTTIIIKNLVYTPEDKKQKYFNKLLDLSRFSFLTDNPNAITLGVSYLEELKNEILSSEGSRIKNKYMKDLGKGIIVSIILTWIIFAVFHSFPFFKTKEFSVYFVVTTGALIGTWVSFGARKFNITLSDLISLEEDYMSIPIRIIYIIISSFVLLLLIRTGFLNISIGNSSIKEWIKESSEVQLLLGILMGLLESKLGIQIYKKANNILLGNNTN